MSPNPPSPSGSTPPPPPPNEPPGAGGPTPRRGRARTGFTLDRFLKYEGLAETGGMAKRLIQDGLVSVNGEVETRRRRQLAGGDVVRIDDQELVVPGDPSGDAGAEGGGIPAEGGGPTGPSGPADRG